MKHLLALILWMISFAAYAAIPSPVGHVNDFAHLFAPEQAASLETKLNEFEQKTSVEIAVVTVDSIEGQDMESWTIRLAQEWGVGKDNKDNGVVIALAKESRDLRIEVGYGLEGVLPDSVCGQIMDREGIPSFKKGDFGEGISRMADAVMARLISNSEPATTAAQPTRGLNEKVALIIVAILVFGTIFVFIIRATLPNSEIGSPGYSTPLISVPKPARMESYTSSSIRPVSRSRSTRSSSSRSSISNIRRSSPTPSFKGFGGGRFGGGGASRKW